MPYARGLYLYAIIPRAVLSTTRGIIIEYIELCYRLTVCGLSTLLRPPHRGSILTCLGLLLQIIEAQITRTEVWSEERSLVEEAIIIYTRWYIGSC